jgi:hypothetical protein
MRPGTSSQFTVTFTRTALAKMVPEASWKFVGAPATVATESISMFAKAEGPNLLASVACQAAHAADVRVSTV